MLQVLAADGQLTLAQETKTYEDLSQVAARMTHDDASRPQTSMTYRDPDSLCRLIATEHFHLALVQLGPGQAMKRSTASLRSKPTSLTMSPSCAAVESDSRGSLKPSRGLGSLGLGGGAAWPIETLLTDMLLHHKASCSFSSQERKSYEERSIAKAEDPQGTCAKVWQVELFKSRTHDMWLRLQLIYPDPEGRVALSPLPGAAVARHLLEAQ